MYAEFKYHNTLHLSVFTISKALSVLKLFKRHNYCLQDERAYFHFIDEQIVPPKNRQAQTDGREGENRFC